MKQLLILSLTAVGLLNLSACHDQKKSRTTQASENHTPAVVISVPNDDDKKDEEESNENTIANCEATANPISEFIRVQTHYGVLSGQPYIAEETGGLLPLTLTEAAPSGSLSLRLDSTVSLVPGQLLTYHSQNFDYYATKISEINGNTVILDENTPIVSGIASGQNLWNFYDNATHPNTIGFNALADYSYRTISTTIEEGATHVLLGDSWFDVPGFAERLTFRLLGSTVINQGNGGDTLCDLLDRFDADVPSSSPKYVWINSSINDYYDDVTQEVFKVRLQDLISKVQAIGATAIVLDSAPLNNGSTSDGTSFLTLSQRYSTQLWDLYQEALAYDD